MEDLMPPPAFLLPNPDDFDGPHVEVAPLAGRRDSPLAPMVKDLLAGELVAGQVILDWLGERLLEVERRDQWHQFGRIYRGLVATAIDRAAAATTSADTPLARQSHHLQVAIDWDGFCRQVRAIFAWDIWDQDSALAFVAAVLRPGNASGDSDGERERGAAP
jgi:hypothetical protein